MWPFKRKPRDVVVESPQPAYEPVNVRTSPASPKAEGIEVQELDATDIDIKELQSRTGMQRVFDRVTGKFK